MLLVGFQSDVSAADQQRILKSVGADEKTSWKKIHGSLAHIASGDVDAAIAELSKDPRVRYAEPNSVISIDSLPNDPSFGNTWGLNNTGQTINGSPGLPTPTSTRPRRGTSRRAAPT
jgi:hypothetical protein